MMMLLLYYIPRTLHAQIPKVPVATLLPSSQIFGLKVGMQQAERKLSAAAAVDE